MAKQLHRWTDRGGRRWACGAYDHGPFCRLCQYESDELGRMLDDDRLSWEVDSSGRFVCRTVAPNG